MPEDVKKRFIAGAICPECKAVDRIVVETPQNTDAQATRRRCISCGFEEQLPEINANPQLPASRLDHERRAAVTPTPVKFIDAGSPGSSADTQTKSS